MSRIHQLLAIAAVSALTALSADAQSKAELDADAREIASYKLTLDALHKVERAMTASAAEMKKDPKVQAAMKLDAEIAELRKAIDARSEKEELTPAEEKAMERDQQKLEELEARKERQEESEGSVLGNARTLTEMEQQIRKLPALESALRREGLTPREYGKFMLAFFQAATMREFQKAGHAPKEMAPVLAENVRWVGQNEKEIARFGEAVRLGEPEKRR